MKLHNIKFQSKEQEEEFEKLYRAYYTYVYKHFVGYVNDFKPDEKPNYWNHTDRDSFCEELEEAGMTIKVCDGY